MRDENGQATIGALILLPVVLFVALAAFLLGGAMILESNGTAACRRSLKESQAVAAEAVFELVQLNPEARLFETARRKTQAAWEAARLSGNPHVMAAAYAAKVAAEVAQTPTLLRQKYWLLQGRQASFLAPARALESVRNALPRSLSGSGFIRVLTGIRKVPLFKLVETSAGDRTPTYRTPPDFAKRQEAKVELLLKFDHRFDGLDRVGRLLVGRPLELAIDVGCAMTLEDRSTNPLEEKWRPQITEDKLIRDVQFGGRL